LEAELHSIPKDIKGTSWVKMKLELMGAIDQSWRGAYERFDSSEEFSHLYKLLTQKWGADEDLTKDLKEILNYHDWITIPEFGEDSNKIALLIVIHADHEIEFQKNILHKIEQNYLSPELSATGVYAHLYDRICTGGEDKTHFRPQRYGSQGLGTKDIPWQPYEIEDFENVDVRRKEIGLTETLQEYFNRMNPDRQGLEIKPIPINKQDDVNTPPPAPNNLQK
jgi:hypothetical protein